jgi:integrase
VTEAVDLIESIERDGPFVFAGGGWGISFNESSELVQQKMPWKPMRATSKAWTALLVAAGLVTIAKPEEGTTNNMKDQTLKARKAWQAHPVRFHDLRRTLRDALTHELEVPFATAEAIIGHTPPPLALVYNPRGVSLSEQREALAEWARYLMQIVTGKKPGKVVNIRG